MSYRFDTEKYIEEKITEIWDKIKELEKRIKGLESDTRFKRY